MPKVKDITAKIRKSLGENLTDEIKNLLADAEAEEQNQQDIIDRVTRESVERKKKINEELTPKIEKLEDEIKKFNEGGLKTELETLRGKVKIINDQNREKWKSLIETVNKNEKLKGKFVSKDKLEDLTDEEISQNLTKFNEYSELGVINVDDKKHSTDGENRFGRRSPDPDPDPSKMSAEDRLAAHIESQLKGK